MAAAERSAARRGGTGSGPSPPAMETATDPSAEEGQGNNVTLIMSYIFLMIFRIS